MAVGAKIGSRSATLTPQGRSKSFSSSNHPDTHKYNAKFGASVASVTSELWLVLARDPACPSSLPLGFESDVQSNTDESKPLVLVLELDAPCCEVVVRREDAGGSGGEAEAGTPEFCRSS